MNGEPQDGRKKVYQEIKAMYPDNGIMGEEDFVKQMDDPAFAKQIYGELQKKYGEGIMPQDEFLTTYSSKKKDGGGASGSEAPSTSKGEPGGPMVGQTTQSFDVTDSPASPSVGSGAPTGQEAKESRQKELQERYSPQLEKAQKVREAFERERDKRYDQKVQQIETAPQEGYQWSVTQTPAQPLTRGGERPKEDEVPLEKIEKRIASYESDQWAVNRQTGDVQPIPEDVTEEQILEMVTQGYLPKEYFTKVFPHEAVELGYDVEPSDLRAWEQRSGQKLNQNQVIYALTNVIKGGLNSIANIVKGTEIAGKMTTLQGQISMMTDKDQKFLGDLIVDEVNEAFPNDPDKQQEFFYKAMTGLGSTLPYLAGGMMAGGSTAAQMATTAAMGAMQNGAIMYQDAIDSGASPQEAWASYLIGTATGTTEAIPITRLFQRVNKVTGGRLKYQMMPQIVKNTVGQSLEEGAQEMFVGVMNNLTARELYDVSREIFSDEVFEEAGIGMFVGGLLGGGGGIVAGINQRIEQTQDQREKELLEKAKENFKKFVEKTKDIKPTEGQPKMTGNKIEAPESVQKEKPEPTTQEPEKTSQAQGEAVETPKSKEDEVQEQDKQPEEEVKPEKEQAETEAKEEGVLEEPPKKGGEDAIQERKTEEVPVQPETESGEEVRKAQPEKVQQAQEEVTEAEKRVKKLEKEVTKLQSQLEKNLTENQGKMFDEGTEQSMFDDRAAQQKMVDEKKKELEGARETLKAAQEKLQRVSDAEGQMEIESKPKGDEIRVVVEKRDNENIPERTTYTHRHGSLVVGKLFINGEYQGDFIDDIEVDQAYRGRGIAGKLIKEATKGRERLTATTSNPSAVKAFYKNDFTVRPWGDEFINDKMTLPDALAYLKEKGNVRLHWEKGFKSPYKPSKAKQAPQEAISKKEVPTPTEPEKTQPAKGEAAKKPSKAQQLREERAKKAKVINREPQTPREMIQQYFASGEKIHTDDLVAETGFGAMINNKRVGMSEFRSRIWAHSKKSPHMDELIQQFKEAWATDHGGELADHDVRAMIIDVLIGYTTKNDLIKDLASRGEGELSMEEELERQYIEWAESHVPESEGAEVIAEEHEQTLTDEEINQIDEFLDPYLDENGNLNEQALLRAMEGREAFDEVDLKVMKLPREFDEPQKLIEHAREKQKTAKPPTEKGERKKSNGTDIETPNVQEQKGLVPVRFKRLGEEMTGTFDGENVTSPEGTVYPLSGVKDLEATKGHLKDPVAQKYGYENIHEAVNSAKKRLGKDVTPETITQKQIEDAAVDSGRTPEGLTELDVSKKDNFDKAIDYLKGLEEKLDKFGKENMSGTIIPIPIFKMAVTTIRKGVEAGKTIKEALQDAWKAIKDTKWYKGLTADERNEALDNFTNRLNDDFTGRVPVSKTATQKKIDKETGVTKERTKITVNEMTSIKDQIRLEARAAREGQKSYKEAQKAFGQRVKDLLKPFSDRLTPSQAKSIVNGALRVNFKNPQITQRYLDYVGRVLQDAEYAGKLAEAKKKAKGARKNIKAGKLGQIAESNPIVQLMAVDPSIVPLEQIDNYLSVANEVGARKSVLPLSEKNALTERASEVMGAVEAENSLIDSLAETYEGYENKQDTYGETLKAMLNDGVITAEEYDLMRERKGDIVEKVQKEERSEEEIQQEIDEAVEGVMEAKKQLPARNNQLSLEENKLIAFFNTITKEDLGRLTLADVNRVGGVMDNISNGHVPHLAEKLREKVEGKRDAHKKGFPAIKGYKGSWVNWVSGAKAGLKNLFNANTTTIKEKIRRNPILYIDQAVKNFKNTGIYETVFEGPASALGQFNLRSQAITNRLNKASEKLGKDSRKAFDSAARIQFYLIQKEYDTNPDSKETMPLADRLQATIDGKDSTYNRRAKERLQELFNEHADAEGNYDADAAYDAMSRREKEVIDELRDIYDGVRFEADYTASVIRGNRIVPRDNYVHIPRSVKGTASQQELDITKQRLLNPSTKAGALQQRTQKASPTTFNPFLAASKSTRETLLDYYLTPAVKTSRQAINELDKLAETQGEIDVVNGIRDVFNETLEVAVGANVFMENTADKIANELIRKGYQAILAGFDRSIVEFGSNFTFGAIYSPSQMMEGIKTMTSGNSDQLGQMVLSVGSTQADRLYGVANMISKNVDFSRVSMIELQRLTGYSSEILNTLKKATIPVEKAYKGVDNIASFLVTKPDQWVARPMWHGQFNQEFRALTNTEPDVAKIANKDQDYMIKYGEAIEAARIKADRLVAESVASNNPFEGIARNQIAPSRNVVAAVYNAFKGFMTRFPTFEYNSALRAVHGMMGNGMLTRAEGTRLLAATMIRMSIYSAFVGTILKLGYNAAMMALGGDPYDDEQDEDFQTQSTNSILRAVVTLALQRNLGNWTKIPVNFGVEYLNKEYGEGVTYKGEYDAFKDNVVYPIVPMEPSHKPLATQIAIGASGPMSPAARTVARGLEAIDYRLKAKKPETKKKWERELMERIPFEVLGNLGYIPFYRDVRKLYLMDKYKNFEDKAKKAKRDTGGREFESRETEGRNIESGGRDIQKR